MPYMLILVQIYTVNFKIIKFEVNDFEFELNLKPSFFVTIQSQQSIIVFLFAIWVTP